MISAVVLLAVGMGAWVLPSVAIAGLLVSGHEGLANTQALLYGGLLALLALASLYLYRPHRAGMPDAPSSKAGRSCSPPVG